jgi:hypothetical protein
VSLTRKDETVSRATELAQAEAERAEAENPDAEPVEPIEPDESEEAEAEETEETPAEPSSLAVIQSMEKALDAEAKRHEKAVAKALGEHWTDFAECPLCQVAGYAMPYQPGEITPEQRDSILAMMGESGNQALAEHPTEVRCPTCDGWGEMRNGSRRAEQATSACQSCMGTGHLDKSSLASNTATLTAVPTYPWDDQPAAPIVAPNVDRWGRNMGHPDFGLDPNTIVATVSG